MIRQTKIGAVVTGPKAVFRVRSFRVIVLAVCQRSCSLAGLVFVRRVAGGAMGATRVGILVVRGKPPLGGNANQCGQGSSRTRWLPTTVGHRDGHSAPESPRSPPSLQVTTRLYHLLIRHSRILVLQSADQTAPRLQATDSHARLLRLIDLRRGVPAESGNLVNRRILKASCYGFMPIVGG